MILADKKKYIPNGLPFLQAQILQQIYLDISKNNHTKLNVISKISDYPPQSKILKLFHIFQQD
ncbi:MAG TPA: hypothetical protein ENL20_10220 [Candidatus Cloacimonetes bacterium]|nr:hypothetical protein [Candidatus Cloacimonadota bacterium]